MAVLRTVVVLLSLSAIFGFAQTAAEPAPTAAQQAPTSETPGPLPGVTLEECVAAARAAGPNLTLASVTRDAARAALAQAHAENGLTLGESGDYFHQGSLFATGTSSTASSTAAAAASGSGVNGENLKGGLSLTGPATTLGLTAQHSMEEGASSDQVSSLNLSGSQTVYDGYPGGRAAAAENLALYQGLFTAGRATKLDVLQVQVALTQAQLDVRTAQNTVVTDRKKLSLATGWPLEKQYSVADSPLPDLPALGTEEALKAAFQNRSELLTLQQDIGAAEIALLLQKSQSLPVVSLKASVGVGQDWTANTTQGAFTAGVSIALPPIYDGGLQDAQVQQAADQVAAYKVQQAQQGQSITIDVGNALFGVADARERNALAGLNVQQAQGQYELEKAKLSAGSGTTLDVLTAFSVLATARVGLAQAKSNYLLAVLNLYNVMGL